MVDRRRRQRRTPNVDCDDTGDDGQTEIEVRPTDQRTVTYRCSVRNRATGEPIVGAHLAGEVMGGPFDDERNGPFRSDYGPYPYHHEDRRLCTTTAPQGHCNVEPSPDPDPATFSSASGPTATTTAP